MKHTSSAARTTKTVTSVKLIKSLLANAVQIVPDFAIIRRTRKNQKLTDAQVRRIVFLHKGYRSGCRELAAAFHVSPCTINGILYGNARKSAVAAS